MFFFYAFEILIRKDNRDEIDAEFAARWKALPSGGVRRACMTAATAKERNDEAEEVEVAAAAAEEDDEEAVNEEKKVELKNSYKYLMDTLAETNPKMIEQVKLFVHEMRRITLLREELWIGTLNQIRKLIFAYSDFNLSHKF